jgi:hypothetical protein
MSIASSAVLVELNISVWPANKLDKSATEAVIADNSAGKNSAQVRKNLLAGSSLRKDISDYAANTRLYNNKHTLPWSDKGARLLPTSLMMDYRPNMSTRQQQFAKLLNNFCANYDTLVGTSKLYMGSLFNENDYPPLEEVQKKFGFRLVFSPLAEKGDFRIDVGNQEIEELSANYSLAYEERMADAMRKPWGDLHDLLRGMSGKLADIDGDEKKRYHDSFVSNAQSMCGLLTSLNITKDPKLEEARRELELTMLGVDIEEVKDSPIVRVDLKTKIDDILKKFDW